MASVLKVQNVHKTYAGRGTPVNVLRDLDFNLDAGESVAIVGPSGSGKTTLLSVCAGLDPVDSGTIEVLGNDLAQMTEDQRAVLRSRQLGFIFQSFHLMPSLTALENVTLPLELQGVDGRGQAKLLLERVGLAHRLTHYPAQLSGGEQQRVAIARAFVNQPKVLFADEPTGNLDVETSQKITHLIFELNREQGTALLLITHDLELARQAARCYLLNGGRLQEPEAKAEPLAATGAGSTC